MGKYFITGVNRGLGLAYAKEAVAAGHHVLGTMRPESDGAEIEELQSAHPDHVTLYISNLDSNESLHSLAQSVSSGTDRIDVLINNAGVMADDETIQSVQMDDLVENYRVNAVLPVLLTQVLLPLLKGSKVINISSSFASIGLKSGQMPPRYSYSMSKAALNMFTKTLAGELSADSTIVVAIHPGWVRTGIGGPEASLSPKESAEAVLQTIDQLTLEQSGAYLTWDGRDIIW